MELQDYLQVTLDRINFKGMSIENIIYIMENNINGGNIFNNPDINYILDLAKKNVSLAKLILTRFPNSLNGELFIILDYVLNNDPLYEFNIIEVDNLTKVGVIQSYIKAENVNFIEENISRISLNNLLLPYRYDNTKTILEICFEKNIVLSDSQMNLIYENEVALTILFNNKTFLNILLEGLIDDSIPSKILDKMFSVQDGILLVNFFTNNFEQLKFNSYFLNLSLSNKMIELIYERYAKGKFKDLLSYLKLPLDKINFNGMSSEDIIYILENNINGGIINNPDINYILNLAKKNVSLAKIMLTKFTKYLNEELLLILDYVLINDPLFSFNIYSINKPIKLEIIQRYLNVGNNEYVRKNISQISILEFLLPYKYDTTKTILEVILERGMFTSLDDDQRKFLFENEDALILLFNSAIFLKTLLEGLKEGNISNDTLIKLNKGRNGSLLAKFFADHFEQLKFNSYFLKLVSSNRMIELVYVKNGFFGKGLLKPNDYFSPTYMLPDNHCYLEYVLFFHERGMQIDFSIEELDEMLKFWVLFGTEEEYLPMYIEYYIRYHRIEPLMCLTEEQMMIKVNGRTIKEYISHYLNSNILDSINGFIMQNEWDKIREELPNLDEYMLTFPYKYDKTKTILDMLLEHNILPSNDIINLLLKDRNAILSFVKKDLFIEEILKLPEEYLLFKPLLSDKTVLETILDKDVSMIKFVKERAVTSVELAEIIIKYDLMFILEVEKECAANLIKKMTLTDQYKLESLGIILSLISKYDISILNGLNNKIIRKYVDIIKKQIKNNPDLLEYCEPFIQNIMLELIYEIVKDDPTKICFLKVKLRDDWFAKFAELVKDNVEAAKNFIKNGNLKILQFLSKEILKDVLPYAYTEHENFDGIPSMAYFDSEIMEIVKKYRPNRLNEEKIQNVINIKNWMIEVMPAILTKYFGNLIDERLIIKVIETTFFEESTMFYLSNHCVTGFYSLETDTCHILIEDRTISEILAVVLHESIHSIFSRNKDGQRITGIDYISTGINEAATELFTQNILGGAYQNPERCSIYYNATVSLRELLNLGIPGLNMDIFKSAYTNNDTSEIEYAIDTFAGNGFFRNRLLPAFNRAIIKGSDAGDLRRTITDLSVLKQKKVNDLSSDSSLGRIM